MPRKSKKETGGEKTIRILRFITGKPYVAMREHFMSLAREGEMDLAIMHIMCILHNRKNNDRFQDMIYCVPPYFMYHLLQKVHHKYFDPETNLPFALSTLSGNDGLEYIDKFKMKKAHYSPFDKPTLTTKARVHAPVQKLSLLSSYDCEVHVLKYLEVVNPLELNKKSYKVPAFSQEQFGEYREEIVERILLDNDNLYKVEAVHATVPRHRQSRPSRHIQSPYVQLNSLDIESGK
ncbi:hypothetical protein PIB30_037846 [Stylosanthes scabra]|uniref:Uncharacterized protein n=1 Tax=Stylosanthes scabra TaxID=79078 RepID=A0ABU6TEK7_9FABA|nr:hypothetical protein [Stylosanthes scabra]